MMIHQDFADVLKDDNQIPVFLGAGESDIDNDFIEKREPCFNYVMGAPNSRITVGVVANPDIIGSQADIVKCHFRCSQYYL